MGVVDTIWVLIVSTIPGLNFLEVINVFRYLSNHQFIVYLLFLDKELMACSRQSEMGLKFKLYLALNIFFHFHESSHSQFEL